MGQQLTLQHIFGICIILISMLGLSIYSGYKVKKASDFDTGGKSSSSVMVAGMLIGTLVGGSSTIGTAELAFNFGLSAWWFTLGSAIGCILLAVVFIKPLRKSGCLTIQQLIQQQFGSAAGIITSILAALGIGLNIVSQVLAANKLLSSISHLNALSCTAISVTAMICYVIFGGANGIRILGIMKSVLLCIAALVGGGLAVALSGGFNTIKTSLPADRYFNLFARGVSADLGAGVSVVLGVLTTQTYVQAILLGRSNAASYVGTLSSALIIPCIGLGGVFMGYYMRIHYPTIVAGEAFPRFIMQHVPPLLGGIILGTLFIAVVGTGAGLALGLSSIVTNNIYKHFVKHTDTRRTLRFSRIVIFAVFLLAVVFTYGNLKSAILTWGFLSMGLRAVALLAPMCAALFFPNKPERSFVTASSIVGILIMLIAKFLKLYGDCLFWGLGGSILTVLLGCVIHTTKQRKRVRS